MSSSAKPPILPSWTIPVAIYGLLAFLMLLAILSMGKFAYTLDDPYIHLALSENIARGHYGVNLQEFSSPSSSILWPFLLAPFMQFTWAEYMPLVLNIIFSIITIIVFNTTFGVFLKNDEHFSHFFKNILSLAFIFIANLLVLSFAGMEHTLQVCLTVCIVSGVIFILEKNIFPKYALIALIFAPLVRYENLALSGCVILFLLHRKFYREAIASAVIIGLIVVGFSIFLHSLGLNYMPSSVMVKSRTAWQSNKIIAVLKSFVANLMSRQGAVMLTYLALLIRPALHEKFRAAALVCIVAIIFHMLFGDVNFPRYANYLQATGFLALFYFYKDTLVKIFSSQKLIIALTALVFVMLSIGGNNVIDTGLLPIGANNIYEQQYQMGRFVREYYKKPVAINDLGLVAFKNDNYVLDLWGLASKPVFDVRIKERIGLDAGDWMNDLARRKNVKFAMIYDPWFPKIPKNWHKVAQLHLGRILVAPAQATVDFYSLDEAETPELLQKLNAFKSTLPPGVKLDIME